MYAQYRGLRPPAEGAGTPLRGANSAEPRAPSARPRRPTMSPRTCLPSRRRQMCRRSASGAPLPRPTKRAPTSPPGQIHPLLWPGACQFPRPAPLHRPPPRPRLPRRGTPALQRSRPGGARPPRPSGGAGARGAAGRNDGVQLRDPGHAHPRTGTCTPAAPGGSHRVRSLAAGPPAGW